MADIDVGTVSYAGLYTRYNAEGCLGDLANGMMCKMAHDYAAIVMCYRFGMEKMTLEYS